MTGIIDDQVVNIDDDRLVFRHLQWQLPLDDRGIIRLAHCDDQVECCAVRGAIADRDGDDQRTGKTGIGRKHTVRVRIVVTAINGQLVGDVVRGVDVRVVDYQETRVEWQWFALVDIERHLVFDDRGVVVVEPAADAVAAVWLEMKCLPGRL